LIEGTEALGVVGPAVDQPVGVVGAGLQEVVVIDGADRLGLPDLPLEIGLSGS
jgi:hypothetical protein